MASGKGEGFNFDDLEELPLEEALPTERFDELEGAEHSGEPALTEGPAPEAKMAHEPETPEKPAKEAKAKRPSQLPANYLEWGIVAGVSVLLLALALVHLLLLSTAVYLISVGLVGYGMWKGGQTSTIYTVILGCALIALLTAIYLLWSEWGRYNYDTKAKDAKRVSASWQMPAGSLAEAGAKLSAVTDQWSA